MFRNVMVICLSLSADAASAQTSAAPSSAPLRVFVDCDDCYGDYVREQIGFVEYVRDPDGSDVHIIITASNTASGGRERSLSFIGQGRFKGIEFLLRSITGAGDTEDTQRQRLATMIKIGLLTYLGRDGAGTLDIQVQSQGAEAARAPAADPWNNWVFSAEGTASADGEETSRELNFTGSVGADRITNDWKITMGFEMEYQREDFDLDEEQPLRAIRNERDFDFLVARSINDHWSAGGRGSIDSSSFNNFARRLFVAPAIEYNLFPYSEYTRRQLRMSYAVGPYYARYSEITLYGTLSDALMRQEASVTLDQREPWGSLQAEFEYSNLLPGLSRYRLQLDGEVAIRLARGLAFTAEGSISRLRDQLSLPARGATEEEVLLRLRQLQSDYEYNFEVGLRYTFGSIFNTIVNPRFGQ